MEKSQVADDEKTEADTFLPVSFSLLLFLDFTFVLLLFVDLQTGLMMRRQKQTHFSKSKLSRRLPLLLRPRFNLENCPTSELSVSLSASLYFNPPRYLHSIPIRKGGGEVKQIFAMPGF